MKQTLAIIQHRIDYLESTLACLCEPSTFNEPLAKGYRLGKIEMIRDELDSLSKLLEDIASNFHWINEEKFPRFFNKKLDFIDACSGIRKYIPRKMRDESH